MKALVTREQDGTLEAVKERMTPLLKSKAVEGQGGLGVGKGAWDCDTMREILPEEEPAVFEEVPTDEFQYEGIPLVPPRRQMTHMTAYFGGMRFRLEAYPDWTVAKFKQALFDGGVQRANPPADVAATPGVQSWEDLAVLYAGKVMVDDKRLADYGVPPGCQA